MGHGCHDGISGSFTNVIGSSVEDKVSLSPEGLAQTRNGKQEERGSREL